MKYLDFKRLHVNNFGITRNVGSRDPAKYLGDPRPPQA